MNDYIGKFLEQIRIKQVMPYLKGYLLDIGCGMNNLVRVYGNGVGIDIYDWGMVDIVVKDISKLPFKDKEFDTVTIIATLNYIPNRDSVLEECYRILRDDGRLIITMLPPGISRLWHWLRFPFNADKNICKMNKCEIYGIRKSDLEKLLKNHCFKLIIYKRFLLVNCLFVFNKKIPIDI
jgi:SAM-dependent methyltransferase